MSRKTFAVIQKSLELKRAALAANREELPFLELPRQKVEAVLTELKDLTAQQASLTASKQEISKRLEDLHEEGMRLMTFVDAGVRQHYGTRSEKLVEFGRQPFRSQPRIRRVGPDGKSLPPNPPPPPANE